jgi:tripartite-type tricarboxylate transporter receptor subunit TctC
VVAELNAAVVQVSKSPEVKERMAAQAADVLAIRRNSSAHSFHDEKVRWPTIVKNAVIKAE